MKKILYVIYIMMGLTLLSHGTTKVIGATRGDVKVIEASEDIRFLSQKIVKDYLYLYKYPNRKEIKIELDRAIDNLSEEFREIAITTKDTDTKDILDFLAYSKDQIKDIFKEDVNLENSALMLDYSETLLEGANSIYKAHSYEFSKEESMLIVINDMKFLLERISKFYIAFTIGFNTENNQEQMSEAIKNFEQNISQINSYSYPNEFKEYRNQINKSWQIDKFFLNDIKNISIPNLILASIIFIEETLDKILLHHTKNQ